VGGGVGWNVQSVFGRLFSSESISHHRYVQ
jgi:hypothetical protein